MSKLIKRVESGEKYVRVFYDYNGSESSYTAYKKLRDNSDNKAIPFLKQGEDLDKFKLQKNGSYWNIIGIKDSSAGGKFQSNSKGYVKTDKDYKVMCLAYAKDLAVASKIETPAIQNTAETFWNWLNK